MSPANVVPEALRGFLVITEVDTASFFVRDLFRRKFGDEPPDVPHHFVALYRDAGGATHVAGYSHMRPFGDIALSGGSCSNGETIRRMRDDEREALYAAGGTWHLILRYAFAHLASRYEAFFGYCGDRRALEVARGAGFVPTGHQHLIVHWHRELHEVMKRSLVAKAQAIGPF